MLAAADGTVVRLVYIDPNRCQALFTHNWTAVNEFIVARSPAVVMAFRPEKVSELKQIIHNHLMKVKTPTTRYGHLK